MGKKGAVALVLLMFSGVVSASFPTTPISRGYDIGVLDGQYFNQTSATESYLVHRYTFDLLSDSNVNVTLVNLIPEMGPIGFEPGIVIFGHYDMRIYDNNDNQLYVSAVTNKWFWGSTMEAKVSGVLPAGEDYYLNVMGGNSGGIPQLAYEVLIQATPVPEPQTWAMLAAGLGVIGFVARRRKQAHFH